MTAENEGEYPAGLMRWSGQRHGGVRKPFEMGSGRPAGTQFVTPIVARLCRWIDDLLEGVAETPRAVLLVGGPGNGKTDAVEGCISYLDEKLGAGGRLVACFSGAFDVPDGVLPPRKVVVDLARLGMQLPSSLDGALNLVQDATEGEPEHGQCAEELLLTELDEIIGERDNRIYLCCVNRGILANSAAMAHEKGGHERALAVLTRITEAATSGPPSRACWPLEGYPAFAIWPMDVESLVSPSHAGDSDTVLHRILRAALDETRWAECEHARGSRCPFCRNRALLADERRLGSLIQLLRYHELATGQRWSFRDLYSLVAYLLAGERDELKIKDKLLPPCEWVARQHEFVRSAKKGAAERTDAPFLLVSRLYHHRLFPRWPSLMKGAYFEARRTVFKGTNLDDGLQAAQGFFRFSTKANILAARAAGNVPERVRGPLAQCLDPAQCTGNTSIFERGGEGHPVSEVEARFSVSVASGLDYVSSQIEPLERDLLKILAQADDAFSENKLGNRHVRKEQLLQASVRQFACRLVKRSLATRYGVCKDFEHLSAYKLACAESSKLSDVRRQLRRLLNDAGGRFNAGLATTFGQPVAVRSRDVVVRLNKQVAIKEWTRPVADDRPVESLPYLLVGDHIVPVTFSFFKALRDVIDGLHQASLPAEIFSLLDHVKATVSGTFVRNEDVLDDDGVIAIGSDGDYIELSGGRFRFVKGDGL